MQKIYQIIKLLRPAHYLKNGLIFLPIFFSGELTDVPSLWNSIIGFICFCAVASGVYVFNDLKDVKFDRRHAKKKSRPIASGAVTRKTAVVLIITLWVIGLGTSVLMGSVVSSVALLFYIAINIAYSMGAKNVPFLDIAILSLGFILRIFYGASLIDVTVSSWLYLTVLAVSFYASFGKRRNEVGHSPSETRKVMRYYTADFLDKNMYMCATLAIVFYALWSIDPSNEGEVVWTVPVVLMILTIYNYSVEKSKSDGDPVGVIIGNKALLLLLALYAVMILVIKYV